MTNYEKLHSMTIEELAEFFIFQLDDDLWASNLPDAYTSFHEDKARAVAHSRKWLLKECEQPK